MYLPFLVEFAKFVVGHLRQGVGVRFNNVE